MLVKLRSLYYKLKYRNLKGSSGAVGVIISNRKKKDDFNEKLVEISKRAVPCYKTNEEVLEYIRNRYILTPVIFSKSILENYKVNYIMNEYPEILATPEVHLYDNRKAPSRKQMQEFQESSNKRFEEAWNYPIEKFAFEFETYKFYYAFPDGYKAEFSLISEKTMDRLSIQSSLDRKSTEEEDKLIRRILDEIDIYKGVTKEDIENKTERFIGYAAAIIDLERINNMN